MKLAGEPKLVIDGKPYPGVSVFASEDDTHIYLVAINLDPDNAHRFTWRHASQSLANKAEVSMVSGPELASDNWSSWGKPQSLLRIDVSSVPVDHGVATFELAAHSMAGLTIAKRAAK